MCPLNNHIDFSRFVALGDSLTAGYKDGALFYEGQIHSYPNLIAQQIHTAFKQPLMDKESVGIGFYGNSRLVLKKETNGAASTISYLKPIGDVEAFSKNSYSTQGPFNNLGVAGAKIINSIATGYGDKNRGEGNYNPYFFRMASDPATASMLSDATAFNPTFFSLFIGNNDVLAYAISGGTMDAITPLEGPAGIGFESSLIYSIDELVKTGAKGILCNLPALHSLPLFNTIPHNGLVLDAENSELLNSKYSSSHFKFHTGHNAFVVEDLSQKKGIRQIENGELISLDLLLDENKNVYLQGLAPVPKNYYLTKEQVKNISNAIDAFNNSIKKTALEKKLAFVDLNQILKTMEIDRTFDGININYKTGGIFALDGLHINSLGHVLLANAFINAINSTYKTNIHKIGLTKFRKNNKLNAH